MREHGVVERALVEYLDREEQHLPSVRTAEPVAS
jgi:hypothetical protein